jgi:hypothetical protein
VLASPAVPDDKKAALRALRAKLNPFSLQRQIERELKTIFALARRTSCTSAKRSFQGLEKELFFFPTLGKTDGILLAGTRFRLYRPPSPSTKRKREP